MQTAFHKLAGTKLTNFDANSISLLFKVANEGKNIPAIKR